MIQYFKSLISSGTRDRICAFLALIAGITLALGFITLICWLGYKDKLSGAELGYVTAGLVALATFSKVDAAKATDKPVDPQ